MVSLAKTNSVTCRYTLAMQFMHYTHFQHNISKTSQALVIREIGTGSKLLYLPPSDNKLLTVFVHFPSFFFTMQRQYWQTIVIRYCCSFLSLRHNDILDRKEQFFNAFPGPC